MSERKVLSKYYPPDFDPSALARGRKPKDAGPPKLATVRLMAPFSMKCTTCGEYIYKGRKFNARKEVTDETYYAIKVIRFYLRCTRCAAEITFKTDPKHGDYTAEKGIRRNFEPWREAKLAEETEEERLDRIEREEAEKDAMAEMEKKTEDAKTEMQIADKLDEIRTRNARIERAEKEGAEVVLPDGGEAEERRRLDEEDAESARRAFAGRSGLESVEEGGDEVVGQEEEVAEKSTMPPPPRPKMVPKRTLDEESLEEPRTLGTFAMPTKKRKQDFGAALGIKKKQKPVSSLVSY
ncbi:MAG: hypothetical protein M1828_005007 [Chrysothrix sp. TS-e1954]|nr:MAG: hypothetical protein M1828_005007 [Chrysothrix sp. TS-e1954]